MATLNAKQVLSNLYGLMMEINVHRTDEEVLADLSENPDRQIDNHLKRIQQLNAKYTAEANLLRFRHALKQIAHLKQQGIDELRRLIKPHEQGELIPLFRKFEELTPEDEASILEDQELLHFMELLNSRFDEELDQ